MSDVHLLSGNPGGYGVTVDNGSGSILITPAGIVGTISATPSINVPGFSISGALLKVEFNKLTTAFNATFTYMNGLTPVTETINVAAGPYLRVTANGVDLPIPGANLIHRHFYFHQRPRPL